MVTIYDRLLGRLRQKEISGQPAGIATTVTDPGTPVSPVWYFAAGPGNYTFFGHVVAKHIGIFAWNGATWDFYETDVEYDISQLVKGWALSESFSIATPTYDSRGYISGGNITWPDADTGTISNVTIGAHGITSIRYNRTGGKYATVNITYDGSGNITETTVVLTGF